MLFFIVNPNSGSGRGAAIWKQTKEYLDEKKIAYELHLTEKSGQAADISKEITEKYTGEEHRLIIIGGDGTLNEVISGLNTSSQIILSYLPAGSGNDFARSMKISHNPSVVLQKIMENPEYGMIDYGVAYAGKEQTNKYRFCVSCGIGFDAAICHELIHSKLKKIMKKIHMSKLIYIVAGLHQICTNHPVKGTIILDNERNVKFDKIWFISCHIHPFEGGGFRLAPNADYGDGKLELCVIHGTGRIGLALIMIGALLGGMHRHLKGVDMYSAREVILQMESPMDMHTDGECYDMETDMKIACMEKSLKFML